MDEPSKCPLCGCVITDPDEVGPVGHLIKTHKRNHEEALAILNRTLEHRSEKVVGFFAPQKAEPFTVQSVRNAIKHWDAWQAARDFERYEKLRRDD